MTGVPAEGGGGAGRTRRRVLERALFLFRTRGIRGTSLEEVARAAGVSRQTVYRHFGSREGLMKALVIHAEEEILSSVLQAVRGKEGRELLEAGLLQALRSLRGHPILDPLLRGEAGEVLPHLTLDLGPITEAATRALLPVILDAWPGLPRGEAEGVLEVAARLVISYSLSPSEEPLEVTAWKLAGILGPALEKGGG